MDTKRVRLLFEDMAISSDYSFLEMGKNDEEIRDVAARRGIQLPSKDLAFFKCKYAMVDQENRNKCTLPRKEVKKALKSLVGKAIDKDHLRKATIGFWLESELVDSDIISYGAFWKSNFPEEFEEIKTRMDSGKMKISFEAWGDRQFKADSNSYDLTNIEFAGGALLFDSEPAFPDAEVLEFSSKQTLEFAKIIEEGKKEEKKKKVTCKACKHEFEITGSKSPCPNCKEMVFLDEIEDNDEIKPKIELPDDEGEIKLINDIEGSELIDETNTIVEAKKLSHKERQKIEDDMFAAVVEKDGKKYRMFPITDESHVKNALARLSQAKESLVKLGLSEEIMIARILKRAEELNMTDLTKRHAKGGMEVDELLKKYNKATVEELISMFDETVASVATRDAEIAELKKTIEEAALKVENAKIELEKVTVEAATAKAELDKRVTAEKAAFIKARRDDLGEVFAKDMTDEDLSNDLKFENAKLKKELSIAKDTKPATEPTKGGLEAGAKTTDTKDPAFTKQDAIQKRAFSA